MHMSDALLSPAVGISMSLVSFSAMAYSVRGIKKYDFDDKKIPIMGVMGAFVFAAQMINFTIPGTGSSGHIGGGILLAAMLGEFPAFLTIASVLIIQSLFFADGGLLALGCNIFNMGLIPCLIIYPLIFKMFIKNKIDHKNLTIASILSVILSLELGALCVTLETFVSSITELPFSVFASFMLPIHLAIGIVEGIVTAAILNFVYSLRPEIIQSSCLNTKIGKASTRKIIIILASVAIITGAVFSAYASSNPDGLEWSIYKVTGQEELKGKDKIHEEAAKVQDSVAIMPSYDYKNGKTDGTKVAGVVGGVLTFALAGVCGIVITIVNKSKKKASKL